MNASTTIDASLAPGPDPGGSVRSREAGKRLEAALRGRGPREEMSAGELRTVLAAEGLDEAEALGLLSDLTRNGVDNVRMAAIEPKADRQIGREEIGRWAEKVEDSLDRLSPPEQSRVPRLPRGLDPRNARRGDEIGDQPRRRGRSRFVGAGSGIS